MARDSFARLLPFTQEGGDSSGGSSIVVPNYSQSSVLTTLPYTASGSCFIIGSLYTAGGGYTLKINDKIVLTSQNWSNINILLNKGDVLSSVEVLDEVMLNIVQVQDAESGGSTPPEIILNPFPFDRKTKEFALNGMKITESSKITMNGLLLMYGANYDYYLKDANTIVFNVKWSSEDFCHIEI